MRAAKVAQKGSRQDVFLAGQGFHQRTDGTPLPRRTGRRMNLLYLGDLDDSQQAGWCRTIEASVGNVETQLALFPSDRTPPPGVQSVQVRMEESSLHRPRQRGARWLALALRK